MPRRPVFNPTGKILVIGTTPVPGGNIDIDKVPGNVQSVLAGELSQNGTVSLTGALADVWAV